MVRVAGLEPVRRGHQILNLTCLPIPPYPHCLDILSEYKRKWNNKIPFSLKKLFNTRNLGNKEAVFATMANHVRHHFPRNLPKLECSYIQIIP